MGATKRAIPDHELARLREEVDQQRTRAEAAEGTLREVCRELDCIERSLAAVCFTAAKWIRSADRNKHHHGKVVERALRSPGIPGAGGVSLWREVSQ